MLHRPIIVAWPMAILYLFSLCGVAEANDAQGNALYRAASQGQAAKVQDLLAQGANPDFQVSGWTALLAAANDGHSDIVSLLLEAGADVDAQEPGGGWSALHFAAYSGHEAVVELLLDAGAPLEQTNQAGQTAIDVANKHPDIMELIASRGGKGNQLGTTLYNAAGRGQTDEVDRLLRLGADPNFQAPDGTPVLQIAAYQGHVEVLRSLIEAGARIDDGDNGRHSALTTAVQQGKREIVVALIDAGADVNHAARISGPGGQLNALHVAVDREDAAMTELLLERGAAVDGTADPLTPPLYYAIRRGNRELVQLLLDQGAALNPDPGQQQVVNSPLHVAAGAGHPDVVSLLLERGAPKTLLNAKRQTPRDIAVENGDSATVQLLDR